LVVPPGVETVITPLDPGPTTAVILEESTTVKDWVGVFPNNTSVAFSKFDHIRK
jgi:hypothetical protein